MDFIKIITVGLLVVTLSLAEEDDIVQGNRKFSVKLFKEIIKIKPNENVVFSPFTLQIVTALLTLATTRSTPAIREIISAVELPTKQKIAEKFKLTIEDLKAMNDDDFKFIEANTIFFGTGCVIKDWFKNSAKENFNADIDTVDFANAANAALRINAWVSQNTDDEIQNFINSNDISKDTKIVLINTLFLSGKWNIPFEKFKTRIGNFYAPSGIKDVDMMNIKKKSYEYTEDNDAQYLKMDLVRDGGGVEMIIALPHQRNGLKSLSENNLDAILSLNKFTRTEMTVALPKFKITSDLALKPILQNLGVKTIFSGALLEGYRFGTTAFNRISEVYQKANIEVDESGVTAISASEIVGLVDSDLNKQQKTFIADHPFLFFIRVDEIIVYAGRFLEP